MTLFNFIMDPGHSWLEVTAEQIEAAGLTLNNFSAFSYVGASGSFYYLEEDCDAPKFIKAWEALRGPITFKELRSDHPAGVRKMKKIHSQP